MTNANDNSEASEGKASSEKEKASSLVDKIEKPKKNLSLSLNRFFKPMDPSEKLKLLQE